MAREELKWQNIDADDLPADVKKSFDAMVEAEAAFKADLSREFSSIPVTRRRHPDNGARQGGKNAEKFHLSDLF
jgi:hypothetical protein